MALGTRPPVLFWFFIILNVLDCHFILISSWSKMAAGPPGIAAAAKQEGEEQRCACVFVRKTKVFSEDSRQTFYTIRPEMVTWPFA